MRTSGARYLQPEANPPGRLPAGHAVAPSSRRQSRGSAAAAAAPRGVPRVASTPVAIRTPVAGSAANSRNRARVATPHRAARGLSSTRCGPQIAPATEEVVSAGGAAVMITTRAPDSARQTAVVSPLTPAPATSTSQSLFGTTVACPARPALAWLRLPGRRYPVRRRVAEHPDRVGGGDRVAGGIGDVQHREALAARVHGQLDPATAGGQARAGVAGDHPGVVGRVAGAGVVHATLQHQQ